MTKAEFDRATKENFGEPIPGFLRRQYLGSRLRWAPEFDRLEERARLAARHPDSPHLPGGYWWRSRARARITHGAGLLTND